MSDIIPFHASDEAYTKLHTGNDYTLCRKTNSMTGSHKNHLPGVPRILLPCSQNNAHERHQIDAYLQAELISYKLNTFSPYLWLVGTQDSSHISALTHQVVRGRNIVLTEDPDLHLTWICDRVLLKPILKVLLSYAFWKCFLAADDNSSSPASSRKRFLEAAKGFLRSYSYLICHRSDFNLAREKGLIPPHTPYAKLVRFLQKFEEISDSDVSPRYHFGELRLGRLNFWSKLIFRRLEFQKVHGDYASYFARFYGPFLFVFSVLSVLLSAMQVLLQAKEVKSSLAVAVMRGFSIFAMVLVAVFVLLLVGMLLVMLLREVLFALGDLRRKRKARTATKC